MIRNAEALGGKNVSHDAVTKVSFQSLFESSGVGPFRSPVLLRGTLPDRLQHEVLTENYSKRNYFQVNKAHLAQYPSRFSGI